MYTKEVRRKIRTLVENFRKNEVSYSKRTSRYNETQLRRDFVDPFFKVLGWDVENKAGLPQNLREVVHEGRVPIKSKSVKRPDYSFRLAGTRKFFVETKRPSVLIEKDSDSAFQLRRYGWSAKLAISVLTNFKYLIIYDCQYKPNEKDDYRTCRLKSYSYHEYSQRFDEIWELLSRESVYSGAFDKRFAKVVVKGRNPVDEYFLAQIEKWRKRLAVDINKKNPRLDEKELNYLVEAFINRIVFLRICEDREIEKYETLLQMTNAQTREQLLEAFRGADKKYNSGIFDFRRDQLSLRVSISDETLIHIIRDLYYPRSPYVFSVIESNILGQIYELFLTKRIVITKNRRIRIVTKPEIAHDLGVVATPNFIVQEIVDRTIKPFCSGKTPEQISKLRFADIACGSGSFLLTAYSYLLDFNLNWYMKHRTYDKIYRGPGNYWHLTFSEKRRILLNNIFGVDIDPNAVEVTQFGLLLKLLEDETEATISDGGTSNSVLPSLDKNIKCGNSLVDKSFFQFRKASELSEEELKKLNVFNWEEAFPEVGQTGFDAIIGNPSYTRIQVMKKLFPLELEYYQKHYQTGQSDNFDKYYIFIERALTLLKETGLVGFIVPHKFMKIKAGRSLRETLSNGKYLQEIVHFGKEQIFEKNTTTYTCIIVLNKSSLPEFRLELVKDLHNWKYYPDKRMTISVKASEMNSSPWLFIIGPLKSLIKRLQRLPKKLSDMAEIFVGLQTSMDKVYIIKPQSISKDSVKFEDFEGKNWEIERSITRSAIYDLKLTSYMKPKPNSLMIFPYSFIKDSYGRTKAVPYNEIQMRMKFPRTLEYLMAYKEQLLKRDVSSPKEDQWLKYGRSQSLKKFDGRDKLVVKVLSLEPCFAYDNSNLYFTGGGNGPYYGVSLKACQRVSLFFLQGILNSKLMDLFVKNWSSVFRGGYYSYGKEFIEKLPIPDVDISKESDKKQHDLIERIVQRLIRLTTESEKAKIPPKRIFIESKKKSLREELNEAVYDLYGLTNDEKTLLRNLVLD